jgi:hypothetical protein
MTRRDVLRLGGLAALRESRQVRFAVLADTHVIDEFYKGPEGSPGDTESIHKANARFTLVRDFLNGRRPPLDAVFIAGDIIHNYPSSDWQFYQEHRTRIDLFKSIADGFRCPCYPGFGNHDYSVPALPREFSHRLFLEKLGLRPYYSVEVNGCRFIHLNNFLGETWNAGGPAFRRDRGSFGPEQLEWFEAELRRNQPVFVFLHFPLLDVLPLERADFGIRPLLRKYRETIQLVIAGHWHRWFDLGFNYGPRHYAIGSTRYDENAYMLVDYDLRKNIHRILNLDCFDWTTTQARPWKPRPST